MSDLLEFNYLRHGLLRRASMFAAEAAPANWRVAFIPVHDAITMAWMEDFKPIDLWRILDSQAAINEAGIALVNVNGLLNLLAWANDLKGHLVPHGDLPESFRNDDGKRLIFVRQNALLALRQNVYKRHHILVALNEDRSFRRVHRTADSAFEDDQQAPLYVDEQALYGDELKAVYVTSERFWWMEIETINDSDRSEVFEHWRMLCTWLQRTAPVLDRTYAKGLPNVVSIKVRFEDIIETGTSAIDIPDPSVLSAAFTTSIDRARGVIAIGVGSSFDRALASADNIAERALVEAFVDAIADLAGSTMEPSYRSATLSQICPSRHARSRHVIRAQQFRDMIPRTSSEPVTVHLMDDALYRIGLGFRVQADVGNEVTGIEECTSFLNSAVRYVLQELCAFLRTFNRKKFVEAVLHSHESAAISRELWRKTAHANVALHGDSAFQVIAEHVAEMNGCSIASRILIEAAICECPLEEGAAPGELDLSRAMAKAIFAFHVGGWSDGVHWEAIAPRVRITPLGDIHIDHTFMDTIYAPFVEAGGEREVQQAVSTYERAYNEPETSGSVSGLLGPRFSSAWEQEYGLSVDTLRRFADEVENLGVQLNSLWFERRKSQLIAMLAACANLKPEDVVSTLDLLILATRESWTTTPAGFREKDWFPWRFRRRLSLVRRPLIQLENASDPTIIVAPALVRDALYILLRSFHNGETPSWQVTSAEMRKWLGHRNNVERSAFNNSVALRMADLGWRSEPEYKLTKLLGIPLDRNYGDVDTLAWHPASGRILAMECKDLQFHKTLGEVAEQLSDFRGVVKPDGTRDLLRKHLDRLAVMEENRGLIAKRLNLTSTATIEGYLVFKNSVPMQFSWEQMSEKVQLLLFEQLETLKISD